MDDRMFSSIYYFIGQCIYIVKLSSYIIVVKRTWNLSPTHKTLIQSRLYLTIIRYSFFLLNCQISCYLWNFYKGLFRFWINNAKILLNEVFSHQKCHYPDCQINTERQFVSVVPLTLLFIAHHRSSKLRIFF